MRRLECTLGQARLGRPATHEPGWGGLIAFILEVIYLSIGLGFWALPALAYTFRPEWAGMAWFIGITGAIVITAIVSLPHSPLGPGAWGVWVTRNGPDRQAVGRCRRVWSVRGT
ncbi:MAG: hypothetical protein HZY76_22640 [Anaerolineae bacterium]|nr:MAG: hypothetical protein HZY76_22640 [Anaerolineae bacterium]